MADGPLHRPTRSTGVLLLVVIFFLGIVCGASLFCLGQRSVGPAAQRSGPRPGPPPGHAPLGPMTRNLGLDQEQQEKIREILERYRGAMDQMLEDSRMEIREVLNEEQQEKFDRIRPPRPGDPRPLGDRPPPGRGRPGDRRHPPPSHDRRPPPPHDRQPPPPQPGDG